MVWRAVQGMVTLGDLALFYQAFSRGQGLMRALLADVGHIYSNSLFLGNLFAFLGLGRVVQPARPGARAGHPEGGHSLSRCAFRHPGRRARRATRAT